MDAGHFQYETDLAVYGTGNTNGVRTGTWAVVDPTLKLGLTNSIDAELQITPYQSVVTRGAAPGESLSGIGDTFARLKINVPGNDRGAVSIALLPYVKLPTAASGLGNGKIEGGLILPVSLSAPGGFTVIVMPEGDYLKDAADNGYHAVFTTQSFRADEKPVYTLDEALTCALARNLQLDFGGNFGLNGSAPRVQLYAGLSQRF